MGIRILALVTDAYGAQGGIAQYNRDLFAALATSDAVDHILVLPRATDGTPTQMPSKVRQLSARLGKLNYAQATARVALRERPFDLIFCGHLYIASLAVVVAKLVCARLWIQVHGIEAWGCPGLLCRWATEQAQLVTSVSRYTRRRFLSWTTCSPQRVKVLPNTVDESFYPGPKPEWLLNKYGLRSRKVLLTVSRLSGSEQYKGHEQVIRAVAELHAEHPDLTYVVAGDGDDRPRLEACARNCGVEHKVRFLGLVADHELPDLYRAADVFVMPSSGEGFGIVFLQALATCVPVVAGNVDGSADPLCDGELGVLVDPANLADLVRELSQLIARDAVRPKTSVDRFSVLSQRQHVERLLQHF